MAEWRCNESIRDRGASNRCPDVRACSSSASTDVCQRLRPAHDAMTQRRVRRCELDVDHTASPRSRDGPRPKRLVRLRAPTVSAITSRRVKRSCTCDAPRAQTSERWGRRSRCCGRPPSPARTSTLRHTHNPQARSAQIPLEAAGQVGVVLEHEARPLELGVAAHGKRSSSSDLGDHPHRPLPELRRLRRAGNDTP